MGNRIDRAVFDEMASVSRRLKVLFDARVKERGLTLSRARALFALAEGDGINQRRLADQLCLETPTVVRLLDGMEKQGFVERRREAEDRRAKQIHLTPTGRSAATDIDRLSCALREQVLEGVSETDKAIALAVIATMSVNLEALEREERA